MAGVCTDSTVFHGDILAVSASLALDKILSLAYRSPDLH